MQAFQNFQQDSRDIILHTIIIMVPTRNIIERSMENNFKRLLVMAKREWDTPNVQGSSQKVFHSKAYAIRVSVSLNPTHWNCTTNFAFHLKQIKNSLTHTKILTHMHLNHQFFLLSNLNPSLIPPSTPNLNKNKN